MFFVPITVKGKSSIPLDHLVTWVRDTAGEAVPIYALLVILLGAVYPFYTKTWNKDRVTTTFSLLKVVGLIAAVLLYFEWGPSWLSDPNMGPFLFEKLVVPVGLLVPLGAVFLAFIVGYGLMEFIGVLVQKSCARSGRRQADQLLMPLPRLLAAIQSAYSLRTACLKKGSIL